MTSTGRLDPLDDLIGKTPLQVRRWMVRKARLADGMEIGLPVCGAPAVHRALARRVATRGEWFVDHDSRTWRGSQLARSGLLRDLCGMPFAQIARVGRISKWRAGRHAELHRVSIAEGGDYASTAAEIAHEALTATMPG